MLNEIQNYFQIDERLITGGQPTSVQLEEVADAGFQVVINLATFRPNYSLPNEKELVEKMGMDYIHIPVIWSNPSESDFQQFCNAMEANTQKRIFIHCAVNYRVSSFMSLYRILYQGCDKEKAMRDLHRIWIPDEIWQSFIDRILTTAKR